MTPQGLGVPWMAVAASLTCAIPVGAQCPLWTVRYKEQPSRKECVLSTGDQVFVVNKYVYLNINVCTFMYEHKSF